MSERQTPPADELAAVRAERKRLGDREAVLRQLLISDPSARTGNSFVVRNTGTSYLNVDSAGRLVFPSRAVIDGTAVLQMTMSAASNTNPTSTSNEVIVMNAKLAHVAEGHW